MSFEQRKPNISLRITDESFNILIEVLKRNLAFECDKSLSENAQKLIDKLMTYSRPFTDEKDRECVVIRFFPNEAKDVVWQLLVRNGVQMNEVETNYYAQLEENHITKTKKEK